MTDIKELDNTEKELLAQLEAIREKRRAAQIEENNRRAAELRTKPLDFEVIGIVGEHVRTRSKYRDDLISILRAVPGRIYKGEAENLIPLQVWQDFIEKVAPLPNVTIIYQGDSQARIQAELSAPDWEVMLYSQAMHIKPGVRVTKGIVGQRIAEAEWNHTGYWMVPLAVSWKIIDALAKFNVWFAPDAAQFIQKQLEARLALENIHQQTEDEEYLSYDLNGNKLMPFQSVGAKFFEVAQGNAICADEMGLGKTWQYISYAKKNEYRNLIIVPASLKPNWEREIFKLTGKRPLVLGGLVPSKEFIIRLLATDAQSQWNIINYETLRAGGVFNKDTETTSYPWIDLINRSNFDLVGLDEAHYIKNTDSNQSEAALQLTAPRKLLLTGTPVINRAPELFPLLHLVAPKQFPDDETFKRQFTIDGKRVKNSAQLKQILRSYMIRRLKSEVIADLPALTRTPQYPPLTKKAFKIYKRILQGIYETLEEFEPNKPGAEKTVANILVQITRLKQVCAVDVALDTVALARELYDQTDEDSPHRKVLIFSQFKGVAYKIFKKLEKEGAQCFVTWTGENYYTANAAERDAQIQRFQKDPKIKYQIVTEKTTKEGHNITAARHVIFNDLFWTPAGHDQAIARAYARLADMHGVDAYYMIAQLPEGEEFMGLKETVMDWIWSLLAFKQGQINASVEGIKDIGGGGEGVLMDLIHLMKSQRR